MRAAVALALGAAFLAGEARAGDAITVASLPEVPTEQTRAAPANIAASEVVKGLWVSAPRKIPPRGQAETRRINKKGKKVVVDLDAAVGAPPSTLVVVTPTALNMTVARGERPAVTLDMDQISKGPTAGTCLRTSDNGLAWHSWATSAMLLELGKDGWFYPMPRETAHEQHANPVRLVRLERLVEGAGDKASLESLDAWVDVRTGGAREVARASTPLALVQRSPGGAMVYGARAGQKAFLVVRPPPPSVAPIGAPPPPLVTFDYGEGSPGHCGFSRVDLGVDKPGDTAAESVGGDIAVPVGDEPQEGEQQSFRVRSFRLSFSETWLTDEPSPALAVSFGWSGRTRVEGRDTPSPSAQRH